MRVRNLDDRNRVLFIHNAKLSVVSQYDQWLKLHTTYEPIYPNLQP